MEDDFSTKVPFSALCELFERLFLASKSTQKKKLFRTFLNHYKSKTFYPLLRLILPQLDRDRQTYGMKETTLGKYYVELLNISPNSEDGRRLIHWKKPTKQGEIEAGDFGNAVFLSLERRCQKKGVLSLAHINKCLDKLNSSPDRKDKLSILKWMLRKTTANEQKWFVRIILKELKMGLSEKTVLNTFHPDALDLYQATSSLKKVANQLNDPNVRLESTHGNISLFNPIKPQLAARKNPDEVLDSLKGDPFIIETKFDGERVQVHKDGNNIKLYSRNSNDITPIYGQKIIPNILKYVKASKCILDGELLVWDSVTQKFEDFGKLKTFANFQKDTYMDDNDDNTTGDIGLNIGKQLCYIVFDVLLVNEKVVTNLPLEQRMVLVKRCVEHTDKIIEIVNQKQATSTSDIISALDTAIINREEGIMVKNLNSTYVPGERKEKWIKLKPEYIDGIVSDLDLLIIGGYYGSGIGRRGGTISHFLLGIVAPRESDNTKDDNIKFLSFCKVGSGYSDNELKVLQKMLQKHWRVFDSTNPPSCIELVPPCKEKPDVWIEPKNSRILQVKAAQIVPSEKFMTRYTLRFPRVQKVRLDKNWNDAMDWNELQVLTKKSSSSLASKRVRDVSASQDEPAVKKRKITTKKSLQVLPAYQQADTSDLTISTSLFSGLEFCILTGNSFVSKKDLERLVYQHGGNRVQYPTSKTNYVIADNRTLRVENLIKTNTCDIIRPSWIQTCTSNSNLIQLEPRFMLFATSSTQQKFLHTIDKFGDHYSKDVTPSNLKQIFQNIPNYKEYTSTIMTKDKLKLLEKQYFIDTPWWGIFRNYTMYIDSSHTLDTISHIAMFYGAEISKKIHKNITHVIIDLDDLSRLDTINRYITKLKIINDVHIVSKQWLFDCIKQHEDLDETDYIPQ